MPAGVEQVASGRRLLLTTVAARVDPSVRVWLLTAGLALAAAIGAARLISLGVLPLALHVPWWLLAAAFLVAESAVVHVHFRDNAHTFSLNEIPIVIGLYFASPSELLVGQLVGAALALHLVRHQPAQKLAFNLAKFCLESCVLIGIFRLFAAGDPLSPAAWLVVLVGLVAMVAFGSALIVLVISVLHGWSNFQRYPELLGFGIASAIASGSLGLAAVAVMQSKPIAGLLLVVPASILVLAYRAYMAERRKRQAAGFLYRATSLVETEGDSKASLLELLEETREVLRAAVAELTVATGDASRRGYRLRVGPNDAERHAEAIEWNQDGPLESRVATAKRGLLLTGADAREAVGERLADSGIDDALVAGLKSKGRLIGTLAVANRLGSVGAFDREDLELFETLAGHVSVALARERLQRQLEFLAFHDSLTGLPNRSMFLSRLEAAQRSAEEGRPAVLFLDIDDFKTVNDSLGHAVGDLLLTAVAQRLQRTLGARCLGARLGGDEFAVLVDGCPDDSDAVATAEQVLRVLREPFELAGERILVRASIGIAFASAEGRAEEVLREADVAMYRAKAAGKSRHVVFEASMKDAVVHRHQIKAELERAVEAGELIVHYQPITDLETASVNSVEALVRWNHPQWGVVSPMRFIPLAEETGLVIDIGRQVLEAAATDLVRWRRKLGVPLAVSVNVSRRQLHEQAFEATVEAVLARTGLEPDALVLEITESSVMTAPDEIVAKLASLRKQGIRIALDDFGTGYSSLEALQDFPVDIIKVAKPFVDSLLRGRNDDFVRVIVGIGDALGLKVVAEGIEEEVQAERLRALGCRLGQGFLFAKPGPAAEIEAFLAAQVVPALRVS